MGEYAPGAVQVVLSMHPSHVQELASWMIGHSRDGSRLQGYAEQIKAQGHGKRLVVLDPEDREAATRLCAAIRWLGEAPNLVDDMQAALRSLLTPPKPEEPKGLGAVVEDADGHKWVRWSLGEWPDRAPWRADGPKPDHRRYDGIDVVRVVSAGVGEAE